MREADVERVAVDDQRALAEAERAELGDERLGLASPPMSRLSRMMRLPPAAFDDSAMRRPNARTFLLRPSVNRRTRGPWALPPPMKIGATTIAVTSGTAALLLAELLAGAVDVRALASTAGKPTTVRKLPRHDAVQDVGTRFDAEHGIVERDVAGLCVAAEGLNCDLHGLAFLILGRVGRIAIRVRGLIVEVATGFCSAAMA